MVRKDLSIRLEPSREELLANQSSDSKSEILRELVCLLESADEKNDSRSAIKRLQAAEEYMRRTPPLKDYDVASAPHENLKLTADQLQKQDDLDEEYIHPDDIDWDDISGYSRKLKADCLSAVINLDVAMKGYSEYNSYMKDKYRLSSCRSTRRYIRKVVERHLKITTKRYKEEYSSIIESNLEDMTRTNGLVTSMKAASRETLYQLAHSFAIYDSLGDYVGSEKFMFDINNNRFGTQQIDSYSDIFDIIWNELYRYCLKGEVHMFDHPSIAKFAELHRVYIEGGEEEVDQKLNSTGIEIADEVRRPAPSKLTI